MMSCSFLSPTLSIIYGFFFFFFFNDTATTEIYTLSLHDALPIRLTELNRHVLLSQPALSRMVDRLADRGLVSRATDPRDGRGVRLALTEEGLAVQRRIGRLHGRSVAQAMLT